MGNIQLVLKAKLQYIVVCVPVSMWQPCANCLVCAVIICCVSDMYSALLFVSAMPLALFPAGSLCVLSTLSLRPLSGAFAQHSDVRFTHAQGESESTKDGH